MKASSESGECASLISRGSFSVLDATCRATMGLFPLTRRDARGVHSTAGSFLRANEGESRRLRNLRGFAAGLTRADKSLTYTACRTKLFTRAPMSSFEVLPNRRKG